VPFYVSVFAVGLAAGFLNVMAGGGSLITLPILIFAGLPVAVANGTNRFAILVQNVAALASFRRQGRHAIRSAPGFALITIPGAIAGAFIAVRISEGAFRAILAGVLVLTVVGLVLPNRKTAAGGHAIRHSRVLALAGFCAVGFYGGFIQAGVGFLIILILHRLLDMDLVQTNMHKVLIILVFSLPALAVFILTESVAWGTAGVLAAGNALGGVVAARVSVRGGERPIRLVMGIALFLMAVRLIW
jgi:uncharacterized membrane protein YfcA